MWCHQSILMHSSLTRTTGPSFLSKFNGYSLAHQEFILLSLEYLLTHNFFVFDGDYYLQRCWASMGACFSPSLANLYMGWWERSRIFACGSPLRANTLFYGRYIDDLILIFSEEADSLEELLAYLNDNGLNLKFTGHKSPISIDFFGCHSEGSGR